LAFTRCARSRSNRAPWKPRNCSSRRCSAWRRAGAYQAYSDLAELYSQAAQLEKAIAALEAMILLQPRSPEPRQRLIEIFRRANRPTPPWKVCANWPRSSRSRELDKAVSVYRAILEVRPDDTRARMAYIETYSQFGPEQDLVTDYLKLAEIHRRHGEIPQAIAAYERRFRSSRTTRNTPRPLSVSSSKRSK
jgi:tetratricopeptide (TPR) repeat protein